MKAKKKKRKAKKRRVAAGVKAKKKLARAAELRPSREKVVLYQAAFRLTTADLYIIDEAQRHLALPTRTETLRAILRNYADQIGVKIKIAPRRRETTSKYTVKRARPTWHNGSE